MRQLFWEAAGGNWHRSDGIFHVVHSNFMPPRSRQAVICICRKVIVTCKVLFLPYIKYNPIFSGYIPYIFRRERSKARKKNKVKLETNWTQFKRTVEKYRMRRRGWAANKQRRNRTLLCTTSGVQARSVKWANVQPWVNTWEWRK